MAQVDRVADELSWPDERRKALRSAATRTAAAIDPTGLTAPEFSAQIYQLVTRISGVTDPYAEAKRRQNATAKACLPAFRERIGRDPDSLAVAVQLALLGNLIDLGNAGVPDATPLYGETAVEPAARNAAGELRHRLDGADTLLYIGDNAGEAVLDALLIAELKRIRPALRVVFAVRGGPAINDVIEADARDAGLAEVAEIVSSGCHFAGTIPRRASPSFRRLFAQADLVVSKGQGNFETLEGEEREILFLFKVKCAMVARHTGWPLGTSVAAWGPAWRGETETPASRSHQDQGEAK